MKKSFMVSCWLLLLKACIILCFEPITTAVAFGGFAIFGTGIVHVIKSRFFSERCSEPWVKLNATGLEHDLKSKIHGQHLVIPAVLSSVRAHMSDANPQKPLVLSFHGWTGGGKNFVSQIIIENLYQKKEKSHYVHIFNSEIHFKHPEKVNVYKDELHSWIYHNVTSCERSIFVFDEMDHMPEGMIDVLIPFLGHSVRVDNIDFRKTIFIFLSNTGADLITKAVLRQWESGKKRESIKLRDLQKVLEMSAYNQKGGLKRAKLVHRNLIDHFIPFLPLESSHVRSCILDEFRRKNITTYGKEDVIDVLNELEWYPSNLSLYSKSGCKKISKKIDLLGLG